MKKKLIGFFVCMLLIATVIPAVTSEKNMMINTMIPNTPHSSITENWIEIQKLLASDGEINDKFGGCVSIDGDYAVIGALGDDDYGNASGAAYVFKRSGSTWIEEQKLTASDGASMDFFGKAVSIYGDYILIGAERDDDNGESSGSVYVFKRSNSTWVQEQKLTASDGATMDNFGCAVSIWDNYSIIGASYNDNGTAYVFKRSGSTWIEEQKLTASDGAAGDEFGWSVSTDGEYVVIGAPSDQDNGYGSGSAYIFTHSGSTWFEQAKLTDSTGAERDWFGLSVSLNGDYAIVGAHLDDNYDSTGSVFVFKRSNSTWEETQKLNISNGHAFGRSVSFDGNNIMISSPAENNNKGAVYIYSYNYSNSSWIFTQKLTTSEGTSTNSVSINDDYAVVGSVNDDSDRGSAYVFVKENENQPPGKPDKPSGETNGNINTAYTYTTQTDDPDGDQVYYNWSWGDGSSSGWLGPYNSGAMTTAEHTWTTEGDYSIKVKAKDTEDAESDWSDPLPVTMPCSYNIPLQGFWERFFQRFPNAFPLLRHLLGY